MFTNNIDKKDFYESKYEYYKHFCFWVVVVSSLASVAYFVSDCQLFGRFAIETLIPRTIILIPMLLYIIFYKKIKSYKVVIVISYLIIHMIMWNTIWAIYYLPIKTHASEGFIIMHMMFLGMGFAAPFHYAAFFHSMVIFNILVSNSFNHYENLDIMLSLGLPCLVSIVIMHYFMQKLYIGHYLTAKKMDYISHYDYLTNVYNRNVLGELIDHDTDKFLPFVGENICVMIFDIDYFKKVNDTYGHMKGDIVLKSLADIVKSMIDKNDYLLRWGGEEFILISSGKNIEEMYEFAQHLRQTVEKSDNGVCKITISAGISSYNGADYKDAIDNADKALYIAKENGRNRVEINNGN